MKNVSNIQAIFIWLAGFDRKTAENCTSSEIRKMYCGSMVMIPGLIGLFSYGYGFYFVFKAPCRAIIGGSVAAFILIMIDP
ncbi:MAG: hypothetical protein IPP29_16985 [Bacteroidetes bacterium]|nr:hypothetical protein [Bacteroidota bacterium]